MKVQTTQNPLPHLISPISIFGPVELYALYNKLDYYIEQHENFQKRSIRNRTLILSANGPLILSIPLNKGKTRQNIRDVGISYAENWIKDYLEGIRSAYASAPYFDYYMDTIKMIILNRPETLFKLFLDCHRYLIDILSIKDLCFTQKFKHIYQNDLDIRTMDLKNIVQIPEYPQVFIDRYDFVPGMSILDLLFNLGPESVQVLNNAKFAINEKRS